MVPPAEHPGQGIFGNSLLVTLLVLLLIAIIALVIIGVILIKKTRKNIIILTPEENEELKKLRINKHNKNQLEEKKIYTVEEIKKELLENEKITDLKLLDQKVILRILEQNGGSALQKDLTKLSGFSKPKLSRIINSLEKRGLIERQPVGQTFLVKLK